MNEESIRNYLDHLKVQNASQYTLKNYTRYLLDFLKFSGGKNITLEMLHKYKRHLSKKGYKKTTQNYFLIALRSYISYTKASKVTIRDISLLKHERTLQAILSQDELSKLLAAPKTTNAEGLRDALILNLLSTMDLKVSQLASFNRADVDKIRKNGSISILIDRYLMLRKDQFKPLFIRFKGKMNPLNEGENMRLSKRSIERMVEKYSREAQVRATPEILRQTFTSSSK